MNSIQKLLLASFLLFANLGFGQWTQVNIDSTDYIEEFSMLNDDLGYARVQINFSGAKLLKKTTDGGITWTPINLPNGGNEFQSANFFADGMGVVVFRTVSNNPTPTVIFQTIDDGANWQNISPDTTVNGIGNATCQFLNQDTGFLATGNMFYATVDGGTNWLKKEFTTTYLTVISMDFYDAMHGTIGTFDGTFAYMGGMLSTTNGGQTWTTTSLTDYQTVIGEVGQLTPTSAYAAPVKWGAGNQLRYFTTTNNGTSWDTVFVPNTVPDASLGDIDFIDENNGVIVLASNTANHIFHTHDGGATWIFQDSITYFNSMDLVLTAGTGYLSGELGTIYKLTGALTVEDPKQNSVGIYPNPVAVGQSLQWKSTEEFSSFRLLDLSGRTVFQQEINGQSVTIPVLPKGIYLARLRGEETIQTVKVIIE